MPPLVVGLALIAALLHATWNALLKASEDPLRFAARAVGSSALIITPLVAIAWFATGRPGLPARGWLFVTASAVLEVVYFVLLSTAYRRGELSVVYPIARGTAPVVAVLIGLAILGERVRGLELVGIVCLLAGIWAVRGPVESARRDAAVVPALATGIMIALYSAVDRVGVRLGPPWLYLFGLWALVGAGLTGVVAWRGRIARGRTESAGRASPATSDWSRALIVGVLMVASFLLVLIAYRLAPLIVVAPLRESAIVLVAAWGIVRLREQERAWLKLAGAVTIVIGIALLALG